MLLGGSQARRRSLRPLRSALLGTALAGLAGCGGGVGRADAPPVRPTEAPRSETLSSLPAGHVWVTRGNRRYAYHDGRFYEWLSGDKRYLTVAAPHGVAVPRPPQGSRVTRIRGVTYHVYRGVYYKPSRRKGRRVYVVAKL